MWSQNGETVAHGLHLPCGIFIDDDDQTIVIVDMFNHRIIQSKMDGTRNERIVAGGNGRGDRLDQLNKPTDVIIDRKTHTIIICDRDNRRVVRWSRLNDTKQGEILINNIDCRGLAMDDQRNLYVSDYRKHAVRRFQLEGNMNEIMVAGGNGEGAGLNQLNLPTFVFVDQQQTVYVSDFNNHRVMKWSKDAKEGIHIAGGQGNGKTLTHLSCPQGLFVDTSGDLYVADSANHRITRWLQGAKQGAVVVGGHGEGVGVNQFKYLRGLFFDRRGNLYVVDNENGRVQRFSLQ